VGLREGRAGHAGSDLTNAQGEVIQNCHNESLLYNEYMQIKTGKKEKKMVESG
jgi:hypothetical protein